ncbi:MAG: CinA family protein [Candidatus Omnitrophota bacterium]
MNKRQESLESRVGKRLGGEGKTLAVAESCTGGAVSHLITNVPGCSEYFLGGVIAYSNEVKISVLGVSPEVIKKYGSVSRKTALAMAEGVRRLLKADIAAALTGIAGPSGSSKEKPVGLVYMAVVSEKRKKIYKKIFKGTRKLIKNQAAKALVRILSIQV